MSFQIDQPASPRYGRMIRHGSTWPKSGSRRSSSMRPTGCSPRSGRTSTGTKGPKRCARHSRSHARQGAEREKLNSVHGSPPIRPITRRVSRSPGFSPRNAATGRRSTSCWRSSAGTKPGATAKRASGCSPSLISRKTTASWSPSTGAASRARFTEGRNRKRRARCRAHASAKLMRIFPERPPRAACATASLILRIG